MLSKKFSAVMMMLLLSVASLVGINSIIIYLPTNVQAQQTPLQGTKGLVTQKQFQSMNQALADKQLLDRIFPQIIKRIDGKTLAAKVLPYLDISANVISRDGPAVTIKRSNPIIGQTGSSPLSSIAKCNNGEIAVGGGFRFDSEPEDSYVSQNIPTQQNGWYSGSQMKVNGKLQASVTCLTLNVGLKNVPQSQQQPPPGGPPLQPPPGSPLIVR